MRPESPTITIACRIRDILERGVDLSPGVMRFIDTTFSDPSADELTAILADESNSERDSLLELLFSPDESVHVDLEELLLRPAAGAIDPGRVADLLCGPALWAGFRLPDGRGWLRACMTLPLARRFVHQLRIDRPIPGPLSAAIDAHRADRQRLRLRVLIRGARSDVLPSQMGFLCALIERLGLEDEVGWECFAFALELLAEIGHTADIYAALAERKKLLIKALNHGRRQRDQLAGANIEILVSRGERLTSVDEASCRRQMRCIDRLCLAAFGRIAHFEVPRPEEAFEVSDPQDIAEVLRRLT
jgi:hypothetical protein